MVQKRSLVICLFLFLFYSMTHAQMKRERVTTEGPVEETFWAPAIVGMSNVHNLPKGNLNVTILHSFGRINDEPFNNFFGLDLGVNVRLGLDYGITDRWSVGVGRTTDGKIYDFRSKVALLKQTRSNSVPVSVAVKGDLGINTTENRQPLGDDLNYFASLMVARKFSDALSLQIAPMYSHFNTVFAGEENDHFAIGLGGEYHLNDRWAIIAEYYPVVGERSDGTNNAFAVGLNIETGGHVFQLFVKSSNWHTEQHVIARTNEEFFEGDIRFGFNVNRIFWLGKK